MCIQFHVSQKANTQIIYSLEPSNSHHRKSTSQRKDTQNHCVANEKDTFGWGLKGGAFDDEEGCNARSKSMNLSHDSVSYVFLCHQSYHYWPLIKLK